MGQKPADKLVPAVRKERGGHMFEKPACPYCHKLSRIKLPKCRGAASKWRICEKNHTFQHKQG